MRKLLVFAMMLLSLLSMGQITNLEKNKVSHTVSHDEVTGYTPRAYSLMRNTLDKRVSYAKQSNTEIPSDKVEIIVEAHKVFGEFAEIGFQMLLDADHSTYGDIFYDWSQAFYDTYSEFEYRLPENADASEESVNVLIDGEMSILIPAGVYDFMLVYPFPGDGIMLTKGDFSRVNDFEFLGGCSYRFVIEYGAFEMPDYSGYDAVVNLFAKTDAAMTDIILPIKGMDFTNEEDITVEIVNRGSEDIERLFVAYQVNDNPMVMERLSQTIPVGDTINYTFNKKADFSVEQLYEVMAWTVLTKDMIAMNDTCMVKCNHMGISQLPYVCDFSTAGAESLVYDWTIENVDGDYSTWMYSEWVRGVDGTYGVASCSGNLNQGNDNLYSVPLYLDAGDNHMIVYTSCVNADKTESLKIAYGMTPVFNEMTQLAHYDIKTTEWVKRVINFNVPQSGVYYFAFNACSQDGYNLFIDDLTIDKGYYEVSPFLRVDKVILPYSNCDLSDSSVIGAQITNIGTGATSEFTLIYTVDYDPSVSQKFTDVLQPTESKIYYFDTTADFAEIGSYEVLVEATCGTEIEGSELGDVYHYEPITELPITTNFMTGENYLSCWTEMNPGTWILDEFGSFCTDYHGIENGLLSHCFALDVPVRIKIQYAKGGWETGRMYIAYGKAGADISTYKTIYQDNDINGAMEVEFDVVINEPDNYSFVIVNTSDEYVSLSLGELTISECMSYDIRLQDVQSPVDMYVPQVQFSDDMTFNAIVINRGSTMMPDVKASLYQGDKLLATTVEGVDIAIGDTVLVPVTVELPYPSIGDTFDFSIKVNGAQSDGYEGDNTFDIPTVHVSDTMYASENIQNIVSGTGMMGEPISIGNVYELSVADVLSSLTVGWAYVEDDDDIVVSTSVSVAVYEVNDDMTLGNRLCILESERGVGGWVNYELPPMLLSPGRYFFEVQQLSVYNMGLGITAGNNKHCYMNVDGVLTQMTGASLLIRANFAHDAIAYNHDVGVVEMLAPIKKETLYTSDETISVRVRNYGSEAADFSILCKVNDKEYTQSLSLTPYEEVNVDFEHIDMAAVGYYDVTIKTVLDGDENTSNDILTETLRSIPEANPYVLDFEHCYDFDAAPDQFNPRWRTVERTGQHTDYFWYYEHPYRGEPVGFIAFNPSATVPVVKPNELPGFYPHAGERFGAAFCVGYYSTVQYSDAWLISPSLKLSTNSSLELYVKTRYVEVEGEEERYAILISDTDDNFESFKVLGDSVRRAPEQEWQLVEVDLSEYDNKDVYVAVRYTGERLKNVCFMVDDIIVKGDGINNDAVVDVHQDIANVVYNAQEDIITVTASNITQVQMYDMQGRVVNTASVDNKDKYRMSVGAISSGVYIIRVTTFGGVSTHKFVIR